MMTILNMYLASRGVALRDNTYNQQQVIDFNIRYWGEDVQEARDIVVVLMHVNGLDEM